MSKTTFLQDRHASDPREIAVLVEDFESVAERARGDDAIDRRSNRETTAARASIEVDGLPNDGLVHGGFHNGERPHGTACHLIGSLVGETLQDFLDYGQASDYVIERHDAFEIERITSSKRLDPD